MPRKPRVDHHDSWHHVSSRGTARRAMYLIQDQWVQFFDEDYVETHEEATYDDEEKTKVLEKITPAMLKATSSPRLCPAMAAGLTPMESSCRAMAYSMV